MVGHLKSTVFALAVSVSAMAYGATVTENFNSNTDSYWIGVNNRAAPNNYGWSEADVTGSSVNPPGGTATAGGELSGVFVRNGDTGVSSDYGFNIGNIEAHGDDPLVLTASGVYRSIATGSGNVRVGFYNSAVHTSGAGDSRNHIGFAIGDGFLITPIGAGVDNEQRGTVIDVSASIGNTMPWEFTYDQAAGTITGSFNGVAFSGDATEIGSDYWRPSEHGPSIFDRFGVFTNDGGGSISGAFDDLTFTSLNPIPEPASFGIVTIAAAAAFARRRRS